MSLNLTAAGLADQKAWEAAGYALPSYDREAMITRTKESPCCCLLYTSDAADDS